MTMTEPSPQVVTENTNSDTVIGVENCETNAQEEVNNLPVQSGGVSNLSSQETCQNVNPCSNDDTSTPGKKGKGRNVKFPIGGYVASYDEPKDPWKNAEYWTTEELVSAYKKSCDKHGTKPLVRLVQQLQKLTCTGKRHDSLVLKGEKLDQKHCECLEEVFRRVQFRQIDLESSHLDDECAVALFDMIEFYCSACQLNISFNKNISMRGWQSCSRLIRRTPSLTALDMRNCDLNERSIPIMGRALKLGSHLTVLHLENIYLSGRPLVILVAALKMNENLLELFLADNKLMPSDGIQLGILLKYNHKLELLDLRNNHLQDVGTRHLSDGLAEQVLERGLLTLVLWNNQITYQGMSSLANCLMVVQNLETLNLGHNNITNDGIHHLKEGLLKNKSLLRLGLQGTKITCEGAVALAEYVADSSKLLRLDLRENDIKTAGLMGLSLALRMNETVTRIDIDKETKKESGVKDYADQQRRLQQEMIWYQERNQVRALEREEDERRELEERAQQEADLRKSAQVLKDAQLTEEAMAYIPSMDRIQRPKLLFSPELSPQQTLESPSVNMGQTNSPEILSPTGTKSFLSPPPADLLLSPQYCPELTAKKIFTVSLVSDGNLCGTPVLESPSTSCIKMPCAFDPQPVLVSPGTLCQNMELETMSEYIEQIVSEAIKSEIPEPISNMQSKMTDNSLADAPISGLLITESQLCSNDKTVKEHSGKHQEELGLPILTDSQNSLNLISSNSEATENHITDMDKLISPDNVMSSFDSYNVMLANNEVTFDSRNGQSVQLTDSIVAELSAVPVELSVVPTEQSEVPVEANSFPSFDLLNSLDNVKPCDSDMNFKIDNNFNSEKHLKNSMEKHVSKEATNIESLSSVKITANNSDLGSEPDPWLKIDSFDLIQQNKIKNVQDVSKPDFHTNLSMNGLTEELASALDLSEDAAVLAKLSPPDVFEQELDDMLAKFQTDINTWPFNSDVNTSDMKITTSQVSQQNLDEQIEITEQSNI